VQVGTEYPPNAAGKLSAKWHPTLLTGPSEILQYFPRPDSDSDKFRYGICPQNVLIIVRITKISITDMLL
jgi:hypothetical protein